MVFNAIKLFLFIYFSCFTLFIVFYLLLYHNTITLNLIFCICKWSRICKQWFLQLQWSNEASLRSFLPKSVNHCTVKIFHIYEYLQAFKSHRRALIEPQILYLAISGTHNYSVVVSKLQLFTKCCDKTCYILII